MFEFKLSIDQNDNNVCHCQKYSSGNWTMIYDEGLTIY